MRTTRKHKKRPGYWSLERCQKEALKFKTRTEWANNSMSSYSKANSKGWLDLCSKHMIQGRKPDDYWTYERCKEDALRFKIKSEWHRFSVGAQIAAIKHGWYEECTAHMISPIKPPGYWTKERCIEDAARFNDKESWVKNSPSSYNVANKHGWMEECSAHMIVKKMPSGYWEEKFRYYDTQLHLVVEGTSSGNYKNGRKEGLWKSYTISGNLHRQKTYEYDGSHNLPGEIIRWYQDTDIVSHFGRTNKDGFHVGLWHWFYNKGELRQIAEYDENGNLFLEKNFNLNGDLLEKIIYIQ